ncbi:S8 family peptidase [Sorangium sp. So ce1153]|uniref:S8 family peptidase n=1 Tax=Sorangium sp. So ce1153 TaxID=3133333 RepID=UPI003F5E6073
MADQTERYHRNQIFVKMRPERPGTDDRTSGGRTPEEAGAAGHPGMTHLDELDRAGLIRRVTPILAGAEPRLDVEPRPRDSLRERLREPLRSGGAPDRARSAAYGVSVVELDPSVDIDDTVRRLSADVAVVYAERVPSRSLFVNALPTRRSSTAPPWNLAKIGWDKVSLTSLPDASAIKVAVLDTGVDRDHLGLGSNVKAYSYAYGEAPTGMSDQDIVGHGTHVSGIIAGVRYGQPAIQGICTCSVHVWKIFDDIPDHSTAHHCFEYYVDTTMYARALQECIDQGVDVINLSIGGPEPARFYRELVEGAIRSGITVVAAMGNGGGQGNLREYPAAYQGVIAVGATASNDVVATSSSRGDHMTISAPGVDIRSTLPRYAGQIGFEAVRNGGEFTCGAPRTRGIEQGVLDGTSMAAAHVTGAVAVLKAQQSGLTPLDVAQKLADSAEKVHGMRGLPRTDDYGYGRLDLYKLLSAGQAGGPVR